LTWLYNGVPNSEEARSLCLLYPTVDVEYPMEVYQVDTEELSKSLS
jgi:hypothetical protein